MKKLILASTAAIAMLGLAACSDTDDTTTQSVPESSTMVPVTPTDDGAVIMDEEPVETESIAPESPDAPVE